MNSEKKSKKLWWKIFFWIFLLLTISGTINIVNGVYSYNFGSYLALIFDYIALIAIFAYIYEKNICNKIIWSIFFWLYLVYLVLRTFEKLPPFLFPAEINQAESHLVWNKIDPYNPSLIVTGIIIVVLLVIPRFIAIYRLSKREKKRI